MSETKQKIKVKFIGATQDQVNWGNNDDPRKLLLVGNIYTVEEVETHSWHTKYILSDFPFFKFNSVCFEEVKP